MANTGEDAYKNVASASDYSFADPTGQFQGALDQFGQVAATGQGNMAAALDPNAAFNTFLGQAGGLSNLAMGPNAQLTQQLNAIASRQAGDAGQNAMTQFNSMGAGRSGAANRAMGEAMANPFAQVAAQQQQNQLNLTGNMWNQAFGGAQQQQNLGANLWGQMAGQGLSGFGNLAGQMGGMVAPQYEYQPSIWEKVMGGASDVMGLGAQGIGMASGLGWQPLA